MSGVLRAWAAAGFSISPVAEECHAGVGHRRVRVVAGGVGPRQARDVVFAEGYWAHNVFKRAGPWAALRRLIACLPAVTLLFAPDERDRHALIDSGAGADAAMGTVAEWRAYGPDFLAMIARLGRRLLVLLVLAVIVAKVPYRVSWWILTLAAAALVVALLRAGFVQDVRMAASDQSEIDAVLEKLLSDLTTLASCVDSIVVVGHSQGGFLSYELLRRYIGGAGHEVPVAFLGVASGLKPIWLLRQFSALRVRVAAWLIAIGMAVAVFGIFVPGYFAKSDLLQEQEREYFDQAVEIVGQPLALTLQQDSQQRTADVLEQLRRALAESPSDVTLVGAATFIVSMGSVWIASKLIRRAMYEGVVILPSFPHGQPTPWWEISSHHDPVGRLLLPMLPQAVERLSWPVCGNGLVDHVRIQGSRHLFAAEVAAFLTDAEPGKNIPPGRSLQIVRARSDDVAYRLTRIRRAHGWLVFMALNVLWLYQLTHHRDVFHVISDHADFLALSLVGVSCSTLVCSVWVRRHGVSELEMDQKFAKPYVAKPPIMLSTRYLGGVLLGTQAAVSFLLLDYVEVLSSVYPSYEPFAEACSLMWLASTVSAVLLVSGYRVRAFFPLASLGWAVVINIATPPLPHAPALPAAYAQPGIVGLIILTALAVPTTVVIRRACRYGARADQS